MTTNITTLHSPQREVLLQWDRPRRLRLSYNALALAEERAQRDGFKVNLSALNPAEYGLRGIRVCLWAGLVQDDPKLTPERVGELIDEFGLAESAKALADAMKLAFPLKPKEDPANPPNPEPSPSPESGTGTNYLPPAPAADWPSTR